MFCFDFPFLNQLHLNSKCVFPFVGFLIIKMFSYFFSYQFKYNFTIMFLSTFSITPLITPFEFVQKTK